MAAGRYTNSNIRMMELRGQYRNTIAILQLIVNGAVLRQGTESTRADRSDEDIFTIVVTMTKGTVGGSRLEDGEAEGASGGNERSRR